MFIPSSLERQLQLVVSTKVVEAQRLEAVQGLRRTVRARIDDKEPGKELLCCFKETALPDSILYFDVSPP